MSEIRSDEGLTLETSAFESLYGGQFTLSTQLIKPNYPLFYVSLRTVAMGTSTTWARVSAFASAYAPLLVSVHITKLSESDFKTAAK